MLNNSKAGIFCHFSFYWPLRHWRALASAAALLILLVASNFAGASNTADSRHRQNPVQSSDYSNDRLSWKQLTPAQQAALMPLQAEWELIGVARKQKWLTIIERFASMTPDERQRAQERMHDWVKLSPSERRVARENFTRAKKLDARQKSERWLEYQQLSEDEKRQLAARASTKKSVTRIPSASRGNNNSNIQPITATPPSALAESVTPRFTHQSALRQQVSP